MAGEDRAPFDSVAFLRDLAEQPHQYGFFAALRRLEGVFRGRPRIGQSLHAAEDPVRLGQDPHLEFAPATLSSFAAPGNRPPRLGVYFLGLFGPQGPLPLHLTDWAHDRLRNAKDSTFSRFADLFHHRILSLFYRAWAMPQPTVSFDRPETDRFGSYVAALVGLGMPSLRGRDAMPDVAKLHFAGLLACQRHNPDGLKSILAAFFAMPTDIVEFVGDWMTLPPAIRTRLGDRETAALGRTATVGARAWGCHQKFRIVFGPMGIDDYRRLIPGGDSLARLVAIVRNYVGDELEWDVNLVLKSGEVPSLQLGRGERLGWTTWLHPRTAHEDAADLHLRPKRYFAPGGRAMPGAAKRTPSSAVGAAVGALAQ